ncbi:hypothetical protein I6N96_09020 [Enterococcus sp. BWM-S5]|uniref:DUF2187 domain-containing protein n=1 Tax=Enterococcus larvae TaxID=2794352 RepID=A0ABS4CIG9_9ENTE|nr:hypothetical protein [Enterococcus larvae]MBP1046424.1 hypothetical protein [Enterococcus larvae]
MKKPSTITEPNWSSGALHIMPIKKRKQKHGNVEVGKIYECDSCKRGSWKYPFRGEVLYINEKSAVVKIISTHEADEYLIGKLDNVTVVPFKNLEVSE